MMKKRALRHADPSRTDFRHFWRILDTFGGFDEMPKIAPRHKAIALRLGPIFKKNRILKNDEKACTAARRPSQSICLLPL